MSPAILASRLRPPGYEGNNRQNRKFRRRKQLAKSQEVTPAGRPYDVYDVFDVFKKIGDRTGDNLLGLMLGPTSGRLPRRVRRDEFLAWTVAVSPTAPTQSAHRQPPVLRGTLTDRHGPLTDSSSTPQTDSSAGGRRPGFPGLSVDPTCFIPVTDHALPTLPCAVRTARQPERPTG